MKQPELGKKIADLRKAQGLTQEELVERCNLSVRTLQRIESGEVVPRSHTIRVIFAATVFVLLTVCMDGNAQSEKKVRQLITEGNKDFIRWFNTGQVDSLMTIYRDDACMLGNGCGKSIIRDFYESQMHIYKFEKFLATSISIADTIAVEKGRWVVRFYSGGTFSGEYLTEWRRKDKKWQIVNDISTPN